MAIVVVNGGHAIVTARIHGTGSEPLYLGWGTGAGTAAVANTTLFTETTSDLSTTSGSRVATGTGSQQTTTNTNDTWQVTGTMTATGAGTVTNIGCWDNATIGSGTLYVKADSASFTGGASVALQSGDSIVPTIKVKFS